MAALQYRDRAKERRDKYGIPEPPSPKSSSSFKSKPKDINEETSSLTINNLNLESNFFNI